MCFQLHWKELLVHAQHTGLVGGHTNMHTYILHTYTHIHVDAHTNMHIYSSHIHSYTHIHSQIELYPILCSGDDLFVPTTNYYVFTKHHFLPLIS